MVTRRNILVGVAAGGGVMMVPRSTLAAENAATLDANKAVVKRYIDEVINGGKLDVIDEIVAEDYAPQGTDDVPGRDALKQRLHDNAENRAGLVNDGQYVIDDLLAERDMVSARMRFTGTNKLAGKPVSALILQVTQVTKGQIRAIWQLADEAALSDQLMQQ